ncbi:MAG TPA: hypothetical protein PLI95_02755 [Polyangiaceae bacterium]|nr:hypothetical protein [Polyangiaceae bacterium]
MSISSMTNAALARRPDFEPVGPPPHGMGQIAKVTGVRDTLPPQGATPQLPPAGIAASNNAISALQVIAAYIPTEVLTLYVAVLGALGEGRPAAWQVFLAFLVATPLVCWVTFAAKLKSAGKPLPLSFKKWPVWEMTAAAFAFCAWAIALPLSPFTPEYISTALAAIVLLVTSTLLGLLAPLFQRALPT